MNIGEISARIQDRAGDFEPTVRAYYTPREIGKAINTCQNLFVFFTLCLETSGSLTTINNQTDYHILSTFPDWLLPLRVRCIGAKVRPSRPQELAALDSAWRNARAVVPKRYTTAGFDYLAIYPTPSNAVDLAIDYARCPVQLPAPDVSPTAVPEIPAEYHQALIDGAIPILRAKEGAGEWQKTLRLWSDFMDAVGKLAAYVRRRNIERGYDTLPPELQRFDASQWLKSVQK